MRTAGSSSCARRLAVTAACVLAACAWGQPLRFETSAPPASGAAAIGVAEQMDREASGIGVGTDPVRSAAASLRRLAAGIIRAGLADGEAGSERVVYGLTLARRMPALQDAISGARATSGEVARRMAALAQGAPDSLPAAEKGLREALAPVADSDHPDAAAFFDTVWPVVGGEIVPAPEVKPGGPADSHAEPETETARLLASLDRPSSPLTMQPLAVRTLRWARAVAGLAARKPAWMAADDHAWFVARFQTELRAAASDPSDADRLAPLADVAACVSLTDSLPLKDARIARKACEAAIARTRAATTLDGAPAPGPSINWYEFRRVLELAAAEPPAAEKNVPPQLRTGVRYLLPPVAHSRTELLEALARATDTGDLQSLALMSARVAHERRLGELERVGAAALVIGAAPGESSRAERGVRAGFEGVARRLRTAGRDLSSASLRDVALAQYRDVCDGLSRFAPSPAEDLIRMLAGTPANAGGGGAGPAGSGQGTGGAAETDQPRSAPAREPPDPEIVETGERLFAKPARGIVSALDAARAAWLESWDPSPARDRSGSRPDASDAQAARDAATLRLTLTTDAVGFLHDACWAFACTSETAAARARLQDWEGWELSPGAARWTVGGLEKSAESVAQQLAKAPTSARDLETLAQTLNDARARFSPALLQGRLAFRLSYVEPDAGAGEHRSSGRAGGGPASPFAALGEIGAGPPPRDAWLVSARHDLAVVCRNVEEGAALALKGKGEDAKAFAAAARSVAGSLLDRDELARGW